MYKLQRIRSRKIIHNVSLRCRQSLTRTVLASRKEMISNAQISLKCHKQEQVSKANSANSSTMQNSQNIECLHNAFLNDTVNDMEHDNDVEHDHFNNFNSNTFDLAIENKSDENKNSLISTKKKKTILKNSLLLCF